MAAVGYCSLTAGPRGSLPENRKPTRHALIGLGRSLIGCNSAGWAGVRSSSRVSGQEHQGRLVNADGHAAAAEDLRGEQPVVAAGDQTASGAYTSHDFLLEHARRG